MRDHHTTSELQSIVGAERANGTPSEIACAERELALRTGSEESSFQRKLSLSGTVSGVLGALFLVSPLLLLAFLPAFGVSPSTTGPPRPFISQYFHMLVAVVGLLQAVCGALLLTGGIGIRFRKPFGPRLISLAVLLGIADIVLLTLASIPTVRAFRAPAGFAILLLALALLNTVFWASLLSLPLRFFVSPRVREACLPSAA